MGSRSHYLDYRGSRNRYFGKCNDREMVEERNALFRERFHETKFLILSPRLGRKKRGTKGRKRRKK